MHETHLATSQGDLSQEARELDQDKNDAMGFEFARWVTLAVGIIMRMSQRIPETVGECRNVRNADLCTNRILEQGEDIEKSTSSSKSTNTLQQFQSSA